MYQKRQHLHCGSDSHPECQGIACRDLKLENVLLIDRARPLIKLRDFDYSKVMALDTF